MRQVRGRGMAVVFQEALNALNPVLTVGRQIEETVMRRDGGNAASARREALRLLDEVRIRRRPSAWATIRTSCPAACASG